jgi:hypothetical protein
MPSDECSWFVERHCPTCRIRRLAPPDSVCQRCGKMLVRYNPIYDEAPWTRPTPAQEKEETGT